VGLLEVDKPSSAVIRLGHSIYFDRVVPVIGSLLADRKAYSYLPESAAYLPPWPRLKQMLEKAGFADVRHHREMLGAVQVVTGVRSLR
jgi:demethylmenaquinone methyltransferase/2-methoxy-6-polyprenyl-1,4-benzoquinol methylase